MRLLIILLIVLLFAGCAVEEQEQPEVTIIVEEGPEGSEEEAAEEPPEGDSSYEEEPEEEGIKVFNITATETRFHPSEINVLYNDRVKLVISSGYEHSFYAPTLGIYKKIKTGETEIYIPTDRKGTHLFWCNMSHYGPEHKRMNGRIRIK